MDRAEGSYPPPHDLEGEIRPRLQWTAKGVPPGCCRRRRAVVAWFPGAAHTCVAIECAARGVQGMPPASSRISLIPRPWSPGNPGTRSRQPAMNCHPRGARCDGRASSNVSCTARRIIHVDVVVLGCTVIPVETRFMSRTGSGSQCFRNDMNRRKPCCFFRIIYSTHVMQFA